MRLAIYSAHAYHREADRVYADRAFVLFLGELARSLERVKLLGRLASRPERARYELAAEIEFVPLTHYESLAQPLLASAAMVRSLRRGWSALDGVEAIWVLGPHPLGLPLVVMAALRRRKVILGVRQDMVAYVRRRHPHRPSLRIAGLMLEGAWRLLALLYPTVVVGPDLARRYRRSRRLHQLTVSLIRTDDVVSTVETPFSGDGEALEILSVGRLEEEKNPLMLAEVFAELCRRDGGRWRLTVCGEGPLADALAGRLRALGLANRATLHGYVPFGQMGERYRSADVLLSSSWTEGFPQVVVEAFAAGLPVVATDVGGIRAGAGDAVMLVPAGDVLAAARAVRGVTGDEAVRRRLVEAGLAWAREHTIEAEVGRLAAFLEG